MRGHRRKPCIAFKAGMDDRQYQSIGHGQGFAIHLGTPNDHDLGMGVRTQSKCGCQRRRRLTALGPKRGVARQDDVGALGQRTSDGQVGRTSHHHGLPRRQRAKALEVSGQMPRQSVVFADDPLEVRCGDDGDGHDCSLDRHFAPERGVVAVILKRNVPMSKVVNAGHAAV